MFSLLAFILVSGCTSLRNEAAKAAYSPMQCQKIPHHPEEKSLCMMMTENKGDIWFIIGNSDMDGHQVLEHFSILEGASHGASSFSRFTVSPGGSYLAILTADEGHPVLRFESMPLLVQDRPGQMRLPFIAPYPGTVQIQNWVSDDKLLIYSDQDLIHYEHGGDLDQGNGYLLYLPSGKLERINPDE